MEHCYVCRERLVQEHYVNLKGRTIGVCLKHAVEAARMGYLIVCEHR